MFKWIIEKYRQWKYRRDMKRRLKKIKEKDPFIYD